MEIFFDFRLNSTQIDPHYRNNDIRLQKITSVLNNVLNDTTINVLELSFCGTASPEGGYWLNTQLAKGRLNALERLVRNEIDVPDSVVTRDNEYIPWYRLAAMVKESDIRHKEEVLDILKGELQGMHGHNDELVAALMALDDGAVWQELTRRFFRDMRNASVVIVTERKSGQAYPGLDVLPTQDLAAATLPSKTVFSDAVLQSIDDGWPCRIHVKTNAVGLAMSVSNAAIELDLAPHFSFNLPVYYSAWNYFTETIKFRALFTQPELRFWFSGQNDGFFVAAHYGIGSFNVAVDGGYRIQDHNGVKPAIGGGFGVGYRMPLVKGFERWKVEFALNVGAYDVKLDYFRNHENGLLVKTEEKTYLGPDMASVSFMYTLGRMNKKGGRR